MECLGVLKVGVLNPSTGHLGEKVLHFRMSSQRGFGTPLWLLGLRIEARRFQYGHVKEDLLIVT